MSGLSPRAVGGVHVRARNAAAAIAVAATATFAPPSFAALLAGYTVVHQMPPEAGAEGQAPAGDLVVTPDGSVYGSSQFLGTASFRCYCTLGGTLWKLNPKGFPVVLHAFAGADGLTASTGLVQGQDRAWYGMTTGGGAHGVGAIYRVATDGSNFTVLHSFGATATEGTTPWRGALVQAADGNFYGTTTKGGAHGLGTVFRLTPAGALTVLHEFAGGAADGAVPRGGLVLASTGDLYGTTLCGGANDATSGCSGTIFRITQDGVFTLLHSFDANPRRGTGALPQAALAEADGMLYGTTTGGGGPGFGTVFRIGLDGTGFATLHEFAGGVGAATPNEDGAKPVGRLMRASDGQLYGTTSEGGVHTLVYPKGDGTIFRITTAGTYQALQSLGDGPSDGSHPVGALAQGPDGAIWGSTETGGANLGGTIFRFPLPPAP